MVLAHCPANQASLEGGWQLRPQCRRSLTPGAPLRSLYHFRLLLALCDDVGFNLCQEFFWYNPAKMLAPAEWVNVRRIRVKDSVEYIFWLSASPHPKADNTQVLQEYSPDMRRLIKRGVKQTVRPSGHNIKESFAADKGGSIPPNLIECGTIMKATVSTSRNPSGEDIRFIRPDFQRRCPSSLSNFLPNQGTKSSILSLARTRPDGWPNHWCAGGSQSRKIAVTPTIRCCGFRVRRTLLPMGKACSSRKRTLLYDLGT